MPAEWAAAWQTWSDAADAVRGCDHCCNSISTSMSCSQEIKAAFVGLTHGSGFCFRPTDATFSTFPSLVGLQSRADCFTGRYVPDLEATPVSWPPTSLARCAGTLLQGRVVTDQGCWDLPGDCQDVHCHNLEQPRGSACITTILWEHFSFSWSPACPSIEFKMLLFTSTFHSSCSQHCCELCGCQ